MAFTPLSFVAVCYNNHQLEEAFLVTYILCMHLTFASMCAKLLQTLWDAMDCCLPGSSVHGILQARILVWVALPFSGDLPDPGIEPLKSPTLTGGSFTTNTT